MNRKNQNLTMKIPIGLYENTYFKIFKPLDSYQLGKRAQKNMHNIVPILKDDV